jgi:hypothetical protein
MNAFVKTGKTYVPLILMLAISLISACSKPAPAADTRAAPPVPPDRVDVVYFYDSEVCHCQIAPGEHIQTTLFINFSGEEATGKLTYQMIDLNDKNNVAIVNKYGATSLSLFINVVRANTENVIAVPEILLVKDDDEALARLVNNRIREYLYGEE